ncbi:hypothetical protein CEXT_591211 [Caerostris extrusa]|uniref:Uncharacterized protein n=1 Tax=Caerostris extrusa TaxID=172846 RepID=A0AAV4MV05_CAEEX|nr:hypothetical protein CEXT_591211 [Caerostris extrusa]
MSPQIGYQLSEINPGKRANVVLSNKLNAKIEFLSGLGPSKGCSDDQCLWTSTSPPPFFTVEWPVSIENGMMAKW